MVKGEFIKLAVLTHIILTAKRQNKRNKKIKPLGLLCNSSQIWFSFSVVNPIGFKLIKQIAKT